MFRVLAPLQQCLVGQGCADVYPEQLASLVAVAMHGALPCAERVGAWWRKLRQVRACVCETDHGIIMATCSNACLRSKWSSRRESFSDFLSLRALSSRMSAVVSAAASCMVAMMRRAPVVRKAPFLVPFCKMNTQNESNLPRQARDKT